MIRINLGPERKTAKTKAATGGIVIRDSGNGPQSLLLASILIAGLLVAAGWSWMTIREQGDWTRKVDEAQQELTRLEEVRKKGDLFKRQKDLLERKIQLITDLKKKQSVPVHILDQVSKNLPEFLWLDAMEATQNTISITGKATTYNAVSNFYDNLSASGYFTGVDLGKTSEAPEGVSFSLTCRFQPPTEAVTDTQTGG
jgi:Tfp pilus assembly protein PilN